MEILTSGSFINLENQDKIEQLKFTATELANAAIGTEGFVNEEEPARKLALEFWQGLEYLCRETEEAAVKNIFVGQFLDRLQELRVSKSTIETLVTVAPDETREKAVEPVEIKTDAQIKTNAEDEFLGVIEKEESDENEESDEKETEQPEIRAPGTEVFSTAENTLVNKVKADEVDHSDDEVDDHDPPLAETVELKTEQYQAVTETAPTFADSVTETQVLEKPVTAIPGTPEKEPYQWGKCTVTIVVQMLPIEDGSMVRKAILSVRTHDFMPQISLVELNADNLSTALAPEIEKAAVKYQGDLPLKVMDKLKKEKAQPKRQVAKPISETKPTSEVSAKNNVSSASQTAVSESNQAETTNQSVAAAAAASPKVETGLQGSLF